MKIGWALEASALISFLSNNERSLSVDGKRHAMLGDTAAAPAKSRLSCPTLCDPIDGSPY